MFYDKMKSASQKEFNERNNFNDLFRIALNMFEYDGLPDTIDQTFLEGILLTNGTVGIAKIKGDLWCGYGGYCGEIHGYLPDEYCGVVTGVGDFRGLVNKDVVVGWNNSLRLPDAQIYKYASILTEIDVSEKLNVLFSRLLRIPKVADQKEKAMVESAIQSILKGNFEAITSNNLNDLLDGGDSKFLDLVDVKDVDKLQYLNQYRDNIYKRFLNDYGTAMQVTSKLAQQTNDEVHGNDASSMIFPLEKLKFRRIMVDNINNTFGTDISVQFSDVWMNNYDEYVNYKYDESNEKEVMSDDVQSEQVEPSSTDLES